jgi:hypothetical protein
MARQELDKSGKWMLKWHGDAVCLLAGAPAVRRCKALQPELVQPRQLPDGLLEVLFAGQTKPEHVLVEVATYPEKRVVQQATDDLLLAELHLGQLPDLVVLVLHPKGKYRVPRRHQEVSPLAWSKRTCEWKVIELWELDAELFLVGSNVGVLPWVVLMKYGGPPEELLRRCCERIEALAPAGQRADLLAVAQVFARLRFKDPELVALLGGTRVMIESPLIKEIEARVWQEGILNVLEGRFGTVPVELTARLRKVRSEKRLKELARFSGTCPNLEAFREKLLS